MKKHVLQQRLPCLMFASLWLCAGSGLAEDAKMVFEPVPAVVEVEGEDGQDDVVGHPKEVDWDALLKAGSMKMDVDITSHFYLPETIRLVGLDADEWRFEVRTRGGWIWGLDGAAWLFDGLLDKWGEAREIKADANARLELPRMPEQENDENVVLPMPVARVIALIEKEEPEVAESAKAYLAEAGEEEFKNSLSRDDFLECELLIFRKGGGGEPAARVVWKVYPGC